MAVAMKTWLPRALLVLAFVALAVAQWLAIYHREQVVAVRGLYLGALAVLLPLFWLAPGPAPAAWPLSPRPPDARPRWFWLLVALSLAIIAWANLGGNRFTPLNVSLWWGSVAAWWGAFWTNERRSDIGDWSIGRLVARLQALISPSTLAFLALMTLALGVRLWRLDAVPPEMNSDHVEKLLDVNDVLTGTYYIFFERNTGREPMQFYVIAAIARGLGTGLTFFSMKLSNVLMALVYVAGTYFWGREVGGRRVGWVAGFFAACSLWAIGTSRIGLRYPFAPAFTSWTMFWLWRALRTERRNDWLLAGLFLGLGLHGYTSFRLMPLIVGAIVALHTLLERPGWATLRGRLGHFALFVGTVALLFLPLGRYWSEEPEMFWYRSLTRSTSLEREITAPLPQLAAQTFVRTYGMFNWIGDRVFVSTIPHVPILDALTSAFFLIGLSWALVVGGLRGRGRTPGLLLLASAFLLILPSALNFAFPLESPSVVRTAGAIPAIAILFALGVRFVYGRLREGSTHGWVWRGSGLLVGALLVAILVINWNRYFGVYVREYSRISMNTVEVAGRMEDFLSLVRDTDHMAIKGWPHWLDTRALAIQLGDVGWSDRHASQTLAVLLRRAPRDGLPLLFVLHPEDSAGMATLKRRYPDGHAILYRSATEGHDWTFFIVPATRPAIYPPRGR